MDLEDKRVGDGYLDVSPGEPRSINCHRPVAPSSLRAGTTEGLNALRGVSSNNGGYRKVAGLDGTDNESEYPEVGVEGDIGLHVFRWNYLGRGGRIHEQGVSLDSFSDGGANWQKYHDGVTWGKSPASFFLVLGESRKTGRNEKSHAAEATKCSPGERVRNGGPRRTLVLMSATPPEIWGLPGKPHVTAHTLPWTTAARVRACRADERHRIFGSVFGLRNTRDHCFRFTVLVRFTKHP